MAAVAGSGNIEVGPVGDGEIEGFLDVFEAAWGFAPDDERRRHTATVVAGESLLGAFADGDMAGTVMSFALLEGGPDGAGCRPVGPSAGTNLRLDAAALGSLFLGGTPVAHLVSAGRIEADSVSSRRAEQMFGAGISPWCSTEFLPGAQSGSRAVPGWKSRPGAGRTRSWTTDRLKGYHCSALLLHDRAFQIPVRRIGS